MVGQAALETYSRSAGLQIPHTGKGDVKLPKLQLTSPMSHQTGQVPAWERQRVGWNLRNLVRDERLQVVKYDGAYLHRGKPLTSETLTIAGEQGVLKFWPNGYLTGVQNTLDVRVLGGARVKSKAWCAVGLFMPPGTNLKIRFFMGELFSEPRDCYWCDGQLHPNQVWMPEHFDKPQLDDIVVGVEVLRNHRHIQPSKALLRASKLQRSPRRVKKPSQPLLWGAEKLAAEAAAAEANREQENKDSEGLWLWRQALKKISAQAAEAKQAEAKQKQMLENPEQSEDVG